MMLGFVLIGVAAVAVSAVLVQRISTAVDDIQKRHSPALESILTLRGTIGDGVQHGLAYLISRDARDKQACLQGFARVDRSLRRFSDVARIDQEGEEQERAIAIRIRSQLADAQARVRALFRSVEQGRPLDPVALRHYEGVLGQLFAATDQLITLEHDEVQSVHRLTLETTARAQLGLWAVAATVVLMASATGVVLRRGFVETEQALAEQRALRDRFVERSIVVQDSERRRVARELHDETGQALSALAVGLRGLAEPPAPDSIRTAASRLQHTTEQLVHGINRLVQGLHPQLIEDHGLVAAIEQLLLVEFRTAHAIEADLDLVDGSDDLGLPPERALAVYRVIQEALTNVARHAKASHVGVSIRRRGDHFRVMIEDDGAGFDLNATRPNAIGLQSMRERATSLGGRLVVESEPGTGTTVVLDFPVSPRARDGVT